MISHDLDTPGNSRDQFIQFFRGSDGATGSTPIAAGEQILEGTPILLGAQVSDPGGSDDLVRYQWTVTGPDNFSLAGTGPSIPKIPTLKL